ncbi:MAG TPA: PAS domain-containing sensor histidine kinase [Gemmatimonadaceae bacterium]|nr:PAS domain-containing sensor histidine kinase [Gemmatimonadaceae bacterium]
MSRPKAGESVDLYRLLVESVRDYAIFVLDARGYVCTWNLGAELTKGYRAEEIIGKHFSIFYPPDDIAAGVPQRALDIASREGRYEMEGWRVRKDGSLFWGDVVITALRDEEGKLVGFGKVTRDLSERRRADIALRQSEERFRLIVTNVRDYGIFMLDQRGIVASWNEGAERISGYKADEIIGRHLSTFYPSEDVKAGKAAAELREALAHGRFEDEGWRVRKDGTSFWSSVIITTLYDDRGRHLGFAKVTRDLTERRASQERAIADARRVAQAEAASRAKSEFLAAMSHELRTPLNAIGGYGELLEIGVGGPVSEQQHEYLERIRRSQQHLLAIINNLLNFSRIEAGQVSYDISNVRMHEVVDRVLELVAPQAERKSLALQHGACPKHGVARADQLKVEQIVLNLLSNAVKFTPEGGKVTASCGHEDGKASIQVRDTGPGVPPDQREAIFEPFVQLGRTLSSSHEGTGLGLAISRDLARAMGGDIQYETAPGGGAIFTLTLPRA